MFGFIRRVPASAIMGLAIVCTYVLIAGFAGAIAPYSQDQVFAEARAPWSPDYWLGTDQLGRDILSRLIFGARNTIFIALSATVISFCVGSSLGMLSAIKGGWIDQAISRTVDVLMAIPSLIFTLMLLSIFGPSTKNLILIIALVDATRVYRLARAASQNVVVMDFIEVAHLRGESTIWLMRREVLPNIAPTLIAEFGLRFSFVFLSVATLSFLGVGIQPPAADWGSMVRENAELIAFARFDMTAAITPILPAAAIAILTVSLNFVVDWLLHKSSGLRDE